MLDKNNLCDKVCFVKIETFLSDFPAHRRFQSRQVDLLRLGEAVCDGEGGVVEGVGTLGVPVTPTLPALYRVT